MISFVWPNDIKYTPWAGGSETYTLNHLKELRRRGIAARLIACNREVAESFKHYPEIPLLALDNETQLEELDDTIVFVLQPMPGITTKHQGYVIIHTPIKGPNRDRTHFFTNGGIGTLRPITTSNYMARYWKRYTPSKDHTRCSLSCRRSNFLTGRSAIAQQSTNTYIVRRKVDARKRRLYATR